MASSKGMAMKKSIKQKKEISDAPILIRAYGEFWNPDLVDWKKSWELLGLYTKRQIVNVYEQRGIYVLYDDYVPVYVGKADRQSIGYRLQLHRESQSRGPRWDRFSWFGLKGINKNGRLGILTGKVHARTPEIISTLEALLILVVDPRMNARKEKLKNAVKIYQSDSGRPLLPIEQELKTIQRKLDRALVSSRHKS